MAISVITLSGKSVNLVAMPSFPGMRNVEFTMDDAVGAVTSIFTGQVQAHQWLGADMLAGTMTLPVLKEADADAWICFLAELRGMANAFQIGDPLKATPRGTGGTGTVTAAAAAGSQSVSLSFSAGALLVGDYIQIGYRLYRLLGPSNGGAVGIWPSLREPLAGSEAVTTANTKGLFRLATNLRTWSLDATRLSQLSFKIKEYR